MDFKQRFISSLRVPERPRSAAYCGKLPDPRKIRRDHELLRSIEVDFNKSQANIVVGSEEIMPQTLNPQ